VKPRLLDLFSGGGGAAMGYARAGFDVVGVDIQPQGNYPFRFWQADAIQVLRTIRADGSPFDVIHASPPCQAYTRKAPTGAASATTGSSTRTSSARPAKLLDEIGLPYVIENVPGAPLNAQLMLCGTMFGLAIRKHRLFESNVPLPLPPAACTDHSECYNPWQGKGRSAAKLRAAMGIDWLPDLGRRLAQGRLHGRPVQRDPAGLHRAHRPRPPRRDRGPGRVTPVLLPREVADLLRVPESTVRAMARDGRLR
jgi:DNA (cytosine-5)-methyltransferase 1